jgi:hypothetical protein
VRTNRAAKGVTAGEFHDAGDELGSAAEEHGEPKNGLVRADLAVRVRIGEPVSHWSAHWSAVSTWNWPKVILMRSLPCTALIQPDHERRQGEADEAKWSGIGSRRHQCPRTPQILLGAICSRAGADSMMVAAITGGWNAGG